MTNYVYTSVAETEPKLFFCGLSKPEPPSSMVLREILLCKGSYFFLVNWLAQ